MELGIFWEIFWEILEGDFGRRSWWKILGDSFCEILRIDFFGGFFVKFFCEILAGVLGAKKFFMEALNLKSVPKISYSAH